MASPNDRKASRSARVQIDYDRRDFGWDRVVYGKVARDADANFLFVRLIGRRAIVDPAGNATVDW